MSRTDPPPGWLVRMAWRDSRGSRKLLLLYTLTVFFGIAALVAIQSLKTNLLSLVDRESRSLLGADLLVQSRRPLSDEAQLALGLLGGEQSREVRLRTMAWFPGPERTAYVDLRAITGGFPFYGEMESDPPDAWPLPESRAKALVEQSLIDQLGLQPGDPVVLGDHEFALAGAMRKVAGESDITGAFAARVYIPPNLLDATGLIQPGAMVRYRTYFRFPPGDTGWQATLDTYRRDLFAREGLRAETVADRRESVRDVFENLLDFLGLIGLSALLLGGLGVAGAVRVYVGSKVESIALLRCLGCGAGAAFRIYLLQLSAAGLAGAALGVAAGLGLQFVLPVLLRDFIPFDLDLTVDAATVISSLLFGWLVAVLFSILPLLHIRRITPLQALRRSSGVKTAGRGDPLRWAVYLVLAAILTGFTLVQADRVTLGLAYAAGIAGMLLALGGVGALLRLAVRRLSSVPLPSRRTFADGGAAVPPGAPSAPPGREERATRLAPRRLPYAVRIALGNLDRPGNRTALLVVTLGVASLLLHLLLVLRGSLLERLDLSQTADAPNLILLDVQPDQLGEARRVLADMNRPPGDPMPVVAMRVHALKGKPLAEWRQTPGAEIEDWVYTWEFRNTQRDHLLDNARIVAGDFMPRHNGTEPIPISLAENLLDDLRVGVGDEIVWNVQGRLLRTVVGSVREVTWKAGRQNFNVVFPLGTLDDAPTTYAVPVRVPGRTEAAEVQARLARTLPGITLIDLTQILDTLDRILSRIGFVIRFMSVFTLGTGLVTLAASIAAGRYQRLREHALFRTLGADRRFLARVPMIEYGAVGFLGGLAGWLLAAVAGLTLLPWVFDLAPKIPPAWTLALPSVFGLLTAILGATISRRILTRSPLASLREG